MAGFGDIGASQWGGLMSAGIGLAAAVMSKPYAPVKQYEATQYQAKQFAVKEYSYSTAPPPDNSVAVYNRAYSKMVGRMNSLEVMFKGERDITAARMKGVKERAAIGLSQDEAAAQIKLNAAAAGVGGGSVSDNMYATHANAAFRGADQLTGEENSIAQAAARVYKGKSGSYVEKDDYSVHTQFTGGDTVSSAGGGPPVIGKPQFSDYSGGSDFSLAGAIMGSMSVFDNDFFKDLGLALEDSPGEISEGEYAINYTPSTDYIG